MMRGAELAWHWQTGACGCAAGVVGGFAGGERGVQQFIEKGEVSLAEPGGAAPPPCAPVAWFPRYRWCACCVRCDAQQEAGVSLKLPEADLSRHAAKHQRRRLARAGGVGDRDDNPANSLLGPGAAQTRGRRRPLWCLPSSWPLSAPLGASYSPT